jgi:hypothetical protein
MWDERTAAVYLAAMIDGEGWILVNINRQVGIFNTDRDLIDAVTECCDVLGLNYVVQLERRAHRRNRQDGWRVNITGKPSLERIRDVVPIRASRKRSKLGEAIAACRQVPRPPREWLVQKYWHEGMSLQQVAEAWGVKNSTSAHCWMEYYGIPRRSVAEGNRLDWRRRKEQNQHGN